MQGEAAKPLLVLIDGDCKVSTKNLARQTGRKSIEPCKPDGTRKAMPVYVEQSILDLEKIYSNGVYRALLIVIEPQSLPDCVTLHAGQLHPGRLNN